MSKYQVMTKVSSLDDGCPLLHECDSLAEAKAEAIEWAEYDDISVWVENSNGKILFQVHGFAHAEELMEKMH